MRRFIINHERFVLEINPDQRSLDGTAELTIQPLTNTLNSIRLNCRHCHIQRALVDETPIEFVYKDPIEEISLGNDADIKHHQTYKSKYLTAIRECDEGEVTINLPEGCIKPLSTNEATLLHPVGSISTPQADSPDPNAITHVPTNDKADAIEPAITYCPITIRIHYSLQNPRAGVVFVEPDINVAPYRFRHVYTVNQPLPGATRTWLPCIDKISERCTWDMEFIVPRRMGNNFTQESSEEHYDDSEETVVVCSGEVVEQVLHPTDPTKKIVRYSLPIPTAAPYIGFAVGPFEMIKLTPSQLQEELLTNADLDENQQQCLIAEINMMGNIYAFALPGHKDDLNVTCSFLMHAMHFYGQEYGSYPFTDFKIAFVEDAWSDTTTTASLSICSSHLLRSPDIIDQAYSSCQILSLALARQWFGVNISQRAWPDIWLICGLAGLMASTFIKRHLGNSEYRLRLKKDIELCCSLDVDRPPLYSQALPSPLDPEDLDFINLKAPLVLYMLDKRMCKGGSTLGLSRVIPKILVLAMSGELPGNAISTHYFLKLCRKVSGYDTRLFADQWVYKSGCPKFTFSYQFNRKKMVVEFHMRQENTNARSGEHSDYLVTPVFTGNLTARIHEADGTPYEHILDIRAITHKFEVQFNTKYKRIRRNTKRFLAKQAAAAAAVAEENPENDDDPGTVTAVGMLGIIPMLGLGMPVFEDEEQRREWHVAEWGQDEEDTSGAASATFDWIRLDAEFEWLCTLEFQQPDYMWAAQLTKDRDVVAQYEALHALKRMPSLQTSTSLLRALLDPKCFYKIRMDAAYTLASCALPELDWVGLLQLNKVFYRRFCFSLNSSRVDMDDTIPVTLAIPRPNNFSNLPDYFLQKSMVIAFSQIRDAHGLVPLKIRQFLLDLLKYNDNTGNEFSDNYYLATLISALGDALVPSISDVHEARELDGPEGEQLLEAAKVEIERFRTLDYVVPSYHNVITISCLQTLTKLMINGLMEVDLKLFLLYTRYGNYFSVRYTAFDSLFILCGLSNNDLTEYFLSIIKHDPSIAVSHYVARSMLVWLGLAIKEDVDPMQSKVMEEFAEEDGRAVIEDNQSKPKMVSPMFDGIQRLRRRFQDNEILQENLWKMLTSTENLQSLDHCIRKYLLQLCEYVYKPVESALKVTIKVPPTTTTITTVLPLTSESTKECVEEKPPQLDHQQQLPQPQQQQEQPAPPLLRLSISKPIQKNTPAQEATPKQTLIRVKTTHKKAIPVSPPPSLSTSPEPNPSSSFPSKRKSIPPNDFKDCRRILGKLQKHRSALLFLRPVSEDLDGAPDYYKIIKEPMDLGTIKTKLERSIYTSFDEFEKDVRLIFNNCYTYNRPGTYVYNEGQVLESIFDTELRAFRGKEEVQHITIVESPYTKNVTIDEQQKQQQQPPDHEKSVFGKCASILSTVMENPHAFEFLRPVDPIKQGIPHYFNVIKEPMDLGTIKAKMASGQYKDQHQFDSDMRLMLNNCYRFNPPGSYVYNEGKQIEKVYMKEWRAFFAEKRKVQELLADEMENATSSQHESESKPLAEHGAKPDSEQNTPVELGLSPISQDEEHSGIQGSKKRRCCRILEKLWNHEVATPFQYPVDPAALNIPDYLDVIKRPMDLSAIRRNLEENKYITIREFEMDVRQIFWNCYRYNDGSSAVVQFAKALEAFFNKQWASKFGVPDKLQGDDLELARKVVSKLRSHDTAPIFNEPVDANAFPDYPTVVKSPMDLRTIHEKLESGQYNSLAQVDDDIMLMLNNCYTYNSAVTYVHGQGKRLERYYKNVGRDLRKHAAATVGPPGSIALSSKHDDPLPPAKSRRKKH
ncbi:hypothetical protein BX666DRAFT_1965766 [Dichotomocladium elegans]|nr:hypothetical protein BX666DRAFT_1965766 [Dichotomocladium elegans]